MSDKLVSEPPVSATSQLTAILGIMGYFSALTFLHGTDTERFVATTIAMTATAVPMILFEVFVLKVYRRQSAGLIGFGSGFWRRLSWTRVGLKLLGLWGTLGLIAFAYWLFPEYHRDFYSPFWSACRDYVPIFLVMAVPYFALVDASMDNPNDGYLNAGYLFTGQMTLVDRSAITAYFLGWLIKGFFLPLMFVYFGNSTAYMTRNSPAIMFDSFPSFVSYIGRLSVGLDLAFVSIGYVLTMRITDSHIRSPNPLFWGWIVTLALYAPFFSIIGRKYLEYNDGIGWLDMFQSQWGVWVFIWGMAIVATKLLWAWANVSFGIRFSNLTHRGIITNGPYRWTRHPSYVFKNISWWLLAVPFFSLEGPTEAVRLSLLLLGINTIYILRAKAEEAHLSQDPTYVAYAQWVEEHGKLRWLGRFLPFLRYSPPESVGSGADLSLVSK